MPRALVILFAAGSLNLLSLGAAPAGEIRVAQEQPFDPSQDQQGDPQQDQAPPYEGYSPEQLDNLLSPVALYPDPLLAQLLVAATFPDQVEEAARYARAYGANGVDNQNWDVSVRAVAHYPTVVEMMGDRIDWTTSVGQAYVNQSTDVTSSIQRLRHMARSAGNLQSSQQQEVLEHDNYIAINPYQPQYIYVPVYDPTIIYYRRPYWGPALSFGIALPIGAWLNLDFRWGYGGAWGGIYYTGWRPGGWGGDCWNCAWINRSRARVNIVNNVYVNNNYTNITVNRTVVNRVVNVNNISRYNYVHRNVEYTNVQANNSRARQVNHRDYGHPGNPPGQYGRPGSPPGVNTHPGSGNKMIDRNIDRGNPQFDQYRGHDDARNDRPETNPRAPQVRQAPQSQMTRPGPHTFSPSEGKFNPRAASQRGQVSRQQPPPPPHSPPQSRAPAKPAPGPHPPKEKKP
jgi:hypothetical protein